MAQLLIIDTRDMQIEIDECDDAGTPKTSGICDEDCHIGDKIKYFDTFVGTQIVRSATNIESSSAYKQKNSEKKETETPKEDAKSKESDKDSFDSFPRCEMLRANSMITPLRVNKQRLNIIQNLKGDTENNIDEQYEVKGNSQQNEENQKDNSSRRGGSDKDLDADYLNGKENDNGNSYVLEKQKKNFSAPPLIITKQSPKSPKISNQTNNATPSKDNQAMEAIAQFKGTLQNEPTPREVEQKNRSRSNSKERSSSKMNESICCDNQEPPEIHRRPSRQFSHRQKQVSQQFIRLNVETQLITPDMDQQDIQAMTSINEGVCKCLPTDAIYSKKKISIMDDMIPQEPDKSYNMEKLQTQFTKCQSKKNIDDKQSQNGLCEYYVRSLLRSVNLALRDNISCLYREHFLSSFQCFHMINTIPVSTQKEIDEKCIIMPPFEVKKKKTLILDLDETLIHCNESLDLPCDYILDIQTDSKEVVQAGINIRPYAAQFLQEMSEFYEIVIFTASRSVYANEVINKLDPQNKYIYKRLFREHCIYKNKIYIKDLRIFKNREMKNLVIVDNCCLSFCHSIMNGVPIIPFYDDKRDQELQELSLFLKTLAEADDVRPIIKNSFKFKQYKNHQSPSELIREVY